MADEYVASEQCEIKLIVHKTFFSERTRRLLVSAFHSFTWTFLHFYG